MSATEPFLAGPFSPCPRGRCTGPGLVFALGLSLHSIKKVSDTLLDLLVTVAQCVLDRAIREIAVVDASEVIDRPQTRLSTEFVLPIDERFSEDGNHGLRHLAPIAASAALVFWASQQ